MASCSDFSIFAAATFKRGWKMLVVHPKEKWWGHKFSKYFTTFLFFLPSAPQGMKKEEKFVLQVGVENRKQLTEPWSTEADTDWFAAFPDWSRYYALCVVQKKIIDLNACFLSRAAATARKNLSVIRSIFKAPINSGIF